MKVEGAAPYAPAPLRQHRPQSHRQHRRECHRKRLDQLSAGERTPVKQAQPGDGRDGVADGGVPREGREGQRKHCQHQRVRSSGLEVTGYQGEPRCAEHDGQRFGPGHRMHQHRIARYEEHERCRHAG